MVLPIPGRNFLEVIIVKKFNTEQAHQFSIFISVSSGSVIKKYSHHSIMSLAFVI